MSKYLLLLTRLVNKSKLTTRVQVQRKVRTKCPKSYITGRRNLAHGSLADLLTHSPLIRPSFTVDASNKVLKTVDI
jgi:hypothetical protein